MSKIIDRTGKGSSISQFENDANLDSLCGINVLESGATYTVDIDNQNETLELTIVSGATVTLDDISTILTAAHTSDFLVRIMYVGAVTVIINAGGTDTFSNGSVALTIFPNQCVTLQSDSTNGIWNIISGYNVREIDGITLSQLVRSDINDVIAGVLTFQSINKLKTTSGITAFAGGGQTNATVLSSDINEIATCATTGDSVKLPTYAIGYRISVHNNGAAALDVFPAVGEDLGAGTNVAVSIASGGHKWFECYDSIKWLNF